MATLNTSMRCPVMLTLLAGDGALLAPVRKQPSKRDGSPQPSRRRLPR